MRRKTEERLNDKRIVQTIKHVVEFVMVYGYFEGLRTRNLIQVKVNKKTTTTTTKTISFDFAKHVTPSAKGIIKSILYIQMSPTWTFRL